jgi:hypothetical protein
MKDTWKTHRITIWEAFLPKINYFSHPPHAYPPVHTCIGPTTTRTPCVVEDVVDDDDVEVSVDHGRKGWKERDRDWAALISVRGDTGKAIGGRGDVGEE